MHRAGEATASVSGRVDVWGEPLTVRVDAMQRLTEDTQVRVTRPDGEIATHPLQSASTSVLVTTRWAGTYARALLHEARIHILGFEALSRNDGGPSHYRLIDTEVGQRASFGPCSARATRDRPE